MVKNIVFLYPGQGAQAPGMGIDLFTASKAVRDLFALASQVVGRDMVTLLRDSDADTLKRTDVSQPAITLANLAAAAVLKEKGVVPFACAGFSLGEYAALATAGVITVAEAFRLVTKRGEAMQKAADKLAAADANGTAPGMAAVLGLPPEKVEALVAEWTKAGMTGLYAANYNSPSQVVLAGTAAALTDAEARFKEAGAKRVIRLKVASPFHSPLLQEAADEFTEALTSAVFSDPKLPLFSNVTGKRVESGAEAKKFALRQIIEPVRWTSEETAISALDPDAILEVGPGKVLQGLWKDCGSSAPCMLAGTLTDIESAVAALYAKEEGSTAAHTHRYPQVGETAKYEQSTDRRVI
ncbi:MAG: ACP S-malonyltransferase [Treponemataceae bacterium]